MADGAKAIEGGEFGCAAEIHGLGRIGCSCLSNCEESGLRAEGYAPTGVATWIDWPNFERGPAERAMIWACEGRLDMLVEIESGAVLDRATFELVGERRVRHEAAEKTESFLRAKAAEEAEIVADAEARAAAETIERIAPSEAEAMGAREALIEGFRKAGLMGGLWAGNVPVLDEEAISSIVMALAENPALRRLLVADVEATRAEMLGDRAAEDEKAAGWDASA